MINFEINNIKLQFETSDTVFSPLNIDKGTLAMLSVLQFKKEDKILDLGCGYGFIGIYIGKTVGGKFITMCDVSKEAIRLTEINARLNEVDEMNIVRSDGLDNIMDENFTIILSNPPYHVDFSVPKKFIEQSHKKLSIGGRMYMVTKRKEWYKNKLISVFGGVQIKEIDGYFVFIAEKKNVKKERKIKAKQVLSKKLQRKQSSYKK
jgi:16S RNA G1207 methylase RsmC